MNAKVIMIGFLIIGVGFVLDSFGLPYNYVIMAVGAVIAIFGFLSKKKPVVV